MDTKNFAIGILSTTAAILLVGLILIQTRPEPAYATGMNDRGGDYILVTGQFQTNMELLYVIDAASEKMMTYGYDLNRGQVQVVGRTVALEKLRVGSGDESKERPTGRRGRGG